MILRRHYETLPNETIAALMRGIQAGYGLELQAAHNVVFMAFSQTWGPLSGHSEKEMLDNVLSASSALLEAMDTTATLAHEDTFSADQARLATVVLQSAL